MPEVILFDALRTPRGKGKAGGALYELRPIDLLAGLLRAVQERGAFDPGLVEDLLIGCVTPIGDQGYNIAKAALLHAGWPPTVPGMQLNRYCASGLEAVNLSAARIAAGWQSLALAGGVESMSRVPMGSDGGALLTDPEVINEVGYLPQGVAADLIATLESFSREEVDRLAWRSHQRAAQAQAEGYFSPSLIPVYDPSGLLILDHDEAVRPDTELERLGLLHPAFAKAGRLGFDDLARWKYPQVERIEHVHTAGNSSGIVDGAALVLLGERSQGEAMGLRARARILSTATVSTDPTLMLGGPAPASRLALERAGLAVGDVDLWEVNEAFASVVLKFQREMGVEEDRVNVNGGSIALGHPLGATGAMLLGTLLDELERRDLSTGVVTLCAGAGIGIATLIERV